MQRAIGDAVLWLVFFLICLGLGYPTLNRYDPRNTGGLGDTRAYYELAVHGPDHADAQLKYRLLIPLLARPVAHAAAGHIGTWDPVFFGFLIVNSFFTATTAYLLVIVGRTLVEGEAVALLALRGVRGALSRETFVPLCIAFTAAWWRASPRRRENSRLVLVPSLAALMSIAILQSVVSGHLMMPWEFAAALVVFVLVTWHSSSPGAAARPLFSVAGPLLSLSAAMYLSRERVPLAR